MLEDKRLQVVIDGCYTVAEEYAEDMAETVDTIRAKNPGYGNLKLAATRARETFINRIKAWKFDQECNEKNKKIFFKQFPKEAQRVLEKADAEIDKQRQEQLKNLQAGVSGN